MNANFYLWVGIISLILFLFKTIMLFVGIDHDIDFDHDMDFDGDHDMDGGEDSFLKYISLQSIISFSLGFGWSGYAGILSGWNEIIVLMIAIFFGSIFFLIIFKFIKTIKGFESGGELKNESLIGKKGRVYLKIKACEKESGMVMIDHGGMVEKRAQTKEMTDLEVGETIEVIEIIGNTLIVKKSN